MFLEFFYHLVLVACMLHFLSLPRPWMGLPSWVLAFLLGDLSWLHLRLATRGCQVERLEVQPWYCVFLMLGAWWPLPWFWPSLGLFVLSLVPPSCFLHFFVVGIVVSLSTHPRHTWVSKEFHWLLSGVNSGTPRVCCRVLLSIGP